MSFLKSRLLPWSLFAVAAFLLAATVHRLIALEGPQKLKEPQRKPQHVTPRSSGAAATAPAVAAAAVVTAKTSIIGTPGGNVILNLNSGRGSPQAVLVRQRANERKIQRIFGPFVSSLNLDAATKAKLLRYLAERAQTMQDAEESASFQGITDPKIVAEARAAASRKVSPGVEEILDANTLETVRQLLSVENEYSAINASLQLDAEFRGAPLTPSTQLKLAKAMVETNYSPLQSAANRINALVGLGPAAPPEDRERFFSMAATILTPEQMDALKACDAGKLAQEELIVKSLQQALEENKKNQPKH